MSSQTELPTNNFLISLLTAIVMMVQISFGSFQAQKLEAGFDPNEYAEMLRVTARQRGPIPDSLFPPSAKYELVYTSPSMGMDNAWQLWTSQVDPLFPQAVISLRATTLKEVSWLENIYCSMIHAQGLLHIADDFQFDYNLADNPRASIHIGWLIGTAFLQRDIIPKMDSLYRAGVRDMIIVGHSQGGAISYLLTAHLLRLQEVGLIPQDLRIKTYSSAAPKPGNLFFAYEYERLTRGGWAFNVINDQDWVPLTPLSLQTKNDFPAANPFRDMTGLTKNLPSFERMYVNDKFKKLTKDFERSSNQMNVYMGEKMTNLIQTVLPEFRPPPFYELNNYQRAGDQIVLQADDHYHSFFPEYADEFFRNHLMDAYQMLLETYYHDQMEEEYIIYLNHRYRFYPEPPLHQETEVNDEEE